MIVADACRRRRVVKVEGLDPHRVRAVAELHVCVLDQEGAVLYERKTESTAQAVTDELAKAPSCRRIVFETGRMAPILFRGLNQLGLARYPVCDPLAPRCPAVSERETAIW